MVTSTKTLQYVFDNRGNRKALIDQDGGRLRIPTMRSIGRRHS